VSLGGGSAGAGTGGSDPTETPNLFATSADGVEVWVNGTKLGATTTAGDLFRAEANYLAGQENVIAVRATKGAAAQPFVHAELDGFFGRAGTSVRWKAKAATTSDETSGGAWAASGYDDSSWGAAKDVAVAPTKTELGNGPARGVWTQSTADAMVLLRMRLFLPADWSVEAPVGLGADVTGGAGGEVVDVTTTSQLAAAVGSAGAKIIRVSGTLDFRGLEGKATASVCYQSQCANGQYEYISNGLGACDSAGKATFDYSYDAAGNHPLLVTSNKTIVGVGPNATIKGKGFKLASGVSNVIIRNLTITDINPELIWGGDAIDLSGANKVWIDHNRISLVGRQFLVSHYDANANVTVSFNDFDGNTTYSATCNGSHYWDMLLLGNGDTMTLNSNWLRQMSGRTPHAGGGASSNVKVHMVNDYHDVILGHAADPGAGGSLLYEGSVFNDVTTPFTANTDGKIYAPLGGTLGGTTAACTAALGRACVANAANSGTSTFRLETAALNAFSSLASQMAKPYPVNEVVNCVPHLAGPGHI
jgi:pectate lyase